jgi:hypothetical protein
MDFETKECNETEDKETWNSWDTKQYTIYWTAEEMKVF